jgi:hypothetical protein
VTPPDPGGRDPAPLATPSRQSPPLAQHLTISRVSDFILFLDDALALSSLRVRGLRPAGDGEAIHVLPRPIWILGRL